MIEYKIDVNKTIPCKSMQSMKSCIMQKNIKVEQENKNENEQEQ